NRTLAGRDDGVCDQSGARPWSEDRSLDPAGGREGRVGLGVCAGADPWAAGGRGCDRGLSSVQWNLGGSPPSPHFLRKIFQRLDLGVDLSVRDGSERGKAAGCNDAGSLELFLYLL